MPLSTTLISFLPSQPNKGSVPPRVAAVLFSLFQPSLKQQQLGQTGSPTPTPWHSSSALSLNGRPGNEGVLQTLRIPFLGTARQRGSEGLGGYSVRVSPCWSRHRGRLVRFMDLDQGPAPNFCGRRPVGVVAVLACSINRCRATSSEDPAIPFVCSPRPARHSRGLVPTDQKPCGN